MPRAPSRLSKIISKQSSVRSGHGCPETLPEANRWSVDRSRPSTICKRAYAVTSQGDAGDAAARIRRACARDRRGARLRQAGIAAMGGLLQGPRRLLAAEAAFRRRSQARRGRLFLRQFRARAGGRRQSARHSRHHRHADRRAGRQARRHRRLRRDGRAHRPWRAGPRGSRVRDARDRSPRRKAWFCCTRSTIRRSSPARPASGSKRSTSWQRRTRRPTSLFCPVGGGGLIGGVALAFHYLSPKTEIIGVEPEGFNGMGTSLAQAQIETMPLGAEIDLRRADGAAAGRGAIRCGQGEPACAASPSPTPRCARR